MDAAQITRAIEVCTMVAEDAKADALALDGLPFDGVTVATNFGQIYVSILALANLVKQLYEAEEART